MRTSTTAVLLVAAGSLFGGTASAGGTIARVAGGFVYTPESNAAPSGVAHTNYVLFAPAGRGFFASAPSGKFETPASLACVYGLAKPTKGCNPETLTTVATGGSKVVVIVDAYDDPTAKNDLAVYSQQFGLPAITDRNFQVVYASGTKPPQDPTGGWEGEEALDIEMAHAMAPGAKIVLVEADSGRNADLLPAEDVATSIAEAAGGGTVSNSWASNETKGEETTEKRFAGRNVVYFASAGDAPGTGWPSALRNVVAVGGTYIDRAADGSWRGDQLSWSGSGGGHSQFVPRPSYQDGVKNRVGAMRGIPDVSFVAAPQSAVWIYDSTPIHGQPPNWVAVGGTSVSSPAMAGVINNAGAFASSTPAELTVAYQHRTNRADWTDIAKGACNNPDGRRVKTPKGYDFCTGIGTPFGTSGK